MAAFQFRMFLQSILGGSNMDERSAKRFVLRALLSTVYPTFELFTHGFMALDPLLFPGVNNTPIEKPVFVVGNPRSGTTYFHRLLAQDASQFVSANTWQIMLPSATQQWVAGLGGHLDDAMDGRLSKSIANMEQKFLANADKIHRTRLHEPEEDDAYLIHIFASGFIQLIFPREELKPLGRLDLMNDENRLEIMGFYKECVQRLMRISGGNRRLLSKNPNFTTKISTLNETFPDAHFIYLVRHPEDAIGSIHSMVTRIWKSQGMSVKEGDSSRREGLVEWVEFLYKHGIECINDLPKDRVTIVRYEDLIPRPDEEVLRVYGELGMEVSPEFRQSLQLARDKSRSHKSNHHYSLDEFGLGRGEIEERLGFVFEQFGYKSRG